METVLKKANTGSVEVQTSSGFAELLPRSSVIADSGAEVAYGWDVVTIKKPGYPTRNFLVKMMPYGLTTVTHRW